MSAVDPSSPSPRERRAAVVRGALDPAVARGPARLEAYAARHGVAAEETLAHLAGRFAGLEAAIARIQALGAHLPPERARLLADALEALRGPYETALREAADLAG